MASGPTHWLSFDVEEYFHAEAAYRAGVRPHQWDELPWRIEPAVDRILALLDRHALRATFFVLGWVARHEPNVVRSIADAGHEVASHGVSHAMLSRLTPEAFRRELLDSRRMLEDLTGRPVLGYRAPTFSVTRRTLWALAVLAECGYRYDSSIFPVRHDRYGVPDAPVRPHWASAAPAGTKILEIPPLTYRLFGNNFPVAGGGYLRLFPVRLFGRALRQAERDRRPGMLYLHPWELDAGHPEVGMKGLGRWRHRVNLRKTERKLEWLLERFSFGPVRESVDELATAPLETFVYAPAKPARSASGV